MKKDPKKVQITTSVDDALYMQYRILSVQRRIPVKNLINEALKAYISKPNADIGIVEPKKAPTAENNILRNVILTETRKRRQ